MIEKTRIVIIEDNPTLNTLYRDILNAHRSFIVIGAYNSAEEALKFLKVDKPQLVLMDIDLPGMSGVECTKKIKAEWPSVDIIMITVFENSDIVFEALCAGATGYLTKNTSPEKLVKAVNETLDGGAPMSIQIAKMVVKSFQKSPKSILSDRETEVLSLLSEGKSYQSIADLLFISKNTIKFHIKNIYEKLQVGTKEDALTKAQKARLI